MRLPESDIKAAILHPEEQVRLTALAYFPDSFGTDESVMPLVIEAVEKYGRATSFRMMRDAGRLPQTESSFDWLLSELQADFDPTDIEQDNHRFAVCLALLAAPVEMLAERREEIAASPNFAPELRPALDELVAMASWDWDTAWTAFNAFVSEMRGKSATIDDHHRQARLIRGLGRMRHEGADQILDLLKGRYRGNDRVLMEWADPWLVDLAGHMRIKDAIPLIVERISEGDEAVINACGTALARIGGDEVVRAIADGWWDAEGEFCQVTPYALEYIHTNLSAETCLEFLEAEDDLEIALMLGNAVLGNFALGHVDAVREHVVGLDDDLEPDQWDLRYRLVAVTTITGERFSEYEAWHADAVDTNYGWGEHERTRISENFGPDDPLPWESEPDILPMPTRKKISRNDPCPCGSGKKYKKCCIDKDFDWVEDDNGNILKSVPMSPEMLDVLSDQREAFTERFGREPGPDDLVFPDIGHPEHVEHEMVELMKAADVDPAKIYAFEKTGRLVTEENQALLSDEELDEWEAAIDEYKSGHGSGEPEYPIGTIALYGPDDTRTTKIVAAVIADPEADPILERWVGSDVTENPKYQQAIGEFFDKHGVESVAASEGNMGCPHEEGEDFPVGEDCPFCPFWEGKQGSGALEL